MDIKYGLMVLNKSKHVLFIWNEMLKFKISKIICSHVSEHK